MQLRESPMEKTTTTMKSTRNQHHLAVVVDEVLAGRKYVPAVASHPVPAVDEKKINTAKKIETMKRSKDTKSPEKLAAEVQLVRVQLARAETEWEACREQWRVAKRRRKEARRAARRARKQFKLAKANLSDVKKALGKTEARLLASGQRAISARKSAKRPVKRNPTTKPKVA